MGPAETILLTSFGWNDAGGGTIVPRYVAAELARRGRRVVVFHAAVAAIPGAPPYTVRTWEEDGVELVGVHNRPHRLLDLGHPRRELDDPPIAAAFAETLDRVRPDAVHFHNLHNLGLSLVDATFSRGIRTVFSTHNYWLLCARNYLFDETLTLCDGPGDGGRSCAPCVGSRNLAGYEARRTELRERFAAKVGTCLAVSEAMRRTLVSAGFDGDGIDVVRQAMPEDEATWQALGRDRRPGRPDGPLRVAFLGSAYPHKGPQLLVEAAQRVGAPISVRIHGDAPPGFDARLAALDRRGVVELRGRYGHGGLPGILADTDVAVLPSLWWDCAPLVARECLSGRVPVLAARLGGLAEAVRDGVDGLLFDGRSADDLARKLERLAVEPGLLERLQAGIEPPPAFGDYVSTLESYYAGGRPARRVAPALPTAVRWEGNQAAASSLAEINREVGVRLAARPDVELERRPADAPVTDAPTARPPDVHVRHAWPPSFDRPATGRLALIQPWEFGSIPLSWQDRLLRDVDEVWVPSAFVARMFRDAGMPADRVHVVPNGFDPARFRPADTPRTEAGLRLLFVGGSIYRKGIDVLLEAVLRAFAGRDDVTLVVKDVGSGSYYRGMNAAERLRGLAERGEGPRVEYVDAELDGEGIGALYRSCDVLVHPYRGEGFAMPVLEAMASGLPVVVTAGGPTDEFCPDAACWRVAAERRGLPESAVGMPTVAPPWMLEPSLDDLVRVLGEVAADPAERRRRGRAAVEAAQAYGWDRIADRYAERIHALAARPPLPAASTLEPFPLPDPAPRTLLATPAWRGADRLPELLRAWAEAVGPDRGAALVLLADPTSDGRAEDWERRVLAAADAAGVDLETAADISVLDHAVEGDDLRRLLGAVDGYVPLHDACEGVVRLAATAAVPVLEPAAAALDAWLRTVEPAGAARRRRDHAA